MASPAYDAEQLGVISQAVAAGLLELQRLRGRPLSEAEKAKASKWITDNVLDAYDSGDRNPIALKLAGLVGVAARIGWAADDV